jgi:hypothetical protein
MLAADIESALTLRLEAQHSRSHGYAHVIYAAASRRRVNKRNFCQRRRGERQIELLPVGTQSRRECDPQGVREGMHPELRHQIGAVDLDCPGGDIEIIGDRLVGQAPGEAFEYVTLARGEAGNDERSLLADAAYRSLSPRRAKAVSMAPSSTVISKGFSTKSTAPAFIARTAIPTSA